ncbi:MAG: site-specific DNA-methyltransferase, partial [Chloroflexi bacterium]|nr:site-specific DNA-methyltransferase [Chloroflexota bacterium]
ELVYAGKEREEDILAETMAVPLQPVKTFGNGDGGDWHNMLIFGDNLQAMKTLWEMKKRGELINADGSRGVKLVYIDPPFATRQEFRGRQEERAYQDKVTGARFLEFLRQRLVFLRELLADGGSIYIHLDWKKVHYIKILLDEVFGEHNFLTEIIWNYGSPSGGRVAGKKLVRSHETIIGYAAHYGRHVYNLIYLPYSEKYVKDWFRYVDEHGRRYQRRQRGRDESGSVTWEMQHLDESPGVPASTVWNDIKQVYADPRAYKADQAESSELTGYPTQKPEKLVGRIVEMASNPGDIVLDVFAGSGTTLAVAEKLGRRWIGIDCGKLAIYAIQKRMFNLREKISNKGKRLELKPFTLYNAGLYDFSKLKRLPWEDWRFFALHLFQCRDEPHTVGGGQLDGYRGADDALAFNHLQHGGVALD